MVAIYVCLQNNISRMKCSYINDLALYKISNNQPSGQLVTVIKSKAKEKLCTVIMLFNILQKNYHNFGCMFSMTYYHKTETCHLHLISMHVHQAGVTGYKLWQQDVLQQQNVYRKFLENYLFNTVQKLKWRRNTHIHTHKHARMRTHTHTNKCPHRLITLCFFKEGKYTKNAVMEKVH
jgi:hypothetical protein